MRALTAWAPTTSSTLATPSLPARAGHDPQRARHRAPHVSGGNGARRRAPMSLEEELRRRADRLAELDRRERQRPTPPSSEQRFWRDVSVLLGTDQGSHAAAALAVGVAVRSCVLCAEGGGITTLDGLDPLDPAAVKRALVICLAGEAGQR